MWGSINFPPIPPSAVRVSIRLLHPQDNSTMWLLGMSIMRSAANPLGHECSRNHPRQALGTYEWPHHPMKAPNFSPQYVVMSASPSSLCHRLVCAPVASGGHITVLGLCRWVMTMTGARAIQTNWGRMHTRIHYKQTPCGHIGGSALPKLNILITI